MGGVIDRIDFRDMPPKPIREHWCAWLRWHGIEPNEVIVAGTDSYGWIERDEERRQIRYLGSTFDEAGRRRRELVEIVHQLEAVPSPFPAATMTP